MLTATMEQIRDVGVKGCPRTRPDRLMAHKGYPPEQTESGCETRAYQRLSPNVTIRSPTGAYEVDARSILVMTNENATGDATSSNDASANSSNGVGSR